MRKINLAQNLYLLAMTILGSVVPFLILGPVLLGVREKLGKITFFLALLVSVGFATVLSPLLGLSALSIGVVLLYFDMLVRKNGNLFYIGVAASVFSTLSICIGLASIATFFSFDIVALLIEELRTSAEKAKTMISLQETYGAMSEWVLLFGISSMSLFSLGISIVLKDKMTFFIESKKNQMLEKIKYEFFKMPEKLIWLLSVSFLFSFLELNTPYINEVSAVVFFFLSIGYFFQGLSVYNMFFDQLKFSFFFKVLLAIIFSTYFFIVIALIGASDFWIDYRTRLIRKGHQL